MYRISVYLQYLSFCHVTDFLPRICDIYLRIGDVSFLRNRKLAVIDSEDDVSPDEYYPRQQLSTPTATQRRRSTADLISPNLGDTDDVRGSKIRYGPRYRNNENTTKLLGQLCNLGQAFQICMQMMYGPDMPTELERGHAQRVLALKAAAHYALDDAELEEMLKSPEEVLKKHLYGFSEAHRQIWRYSLFEATRTHFDLQVFTVLRPTVEIQGAPPPRFSSLGLLMMAWMCAEHLGLKSEESFMKL